METPGAATNGAGDSLERTELASGRGRRPIVKRPWLAVIGAALFVTALLDLPALSAPFFGDDEAILEVLEGVDPPMMTARSHLDLYRFFSGDPADCTERMRVGALPWRTDRDQKFAHFRPVASALLWLDHELFGLDPLWPHAHSLVWSLALVLAIGLLYRRILPRRQGALALLLVAVSSHSDLAVSWWAAREALLAAVFGTLGLVAHIRWRQERWRPGLPLSVLCFALALGSAEMALQFLAFLAAFAVWGDQGPLRQRLVTILPAIAVALVYLIARSALDYGVAGSFSKIDPLADPLGYVHNLWATVPPATGQLLAQRFAIATVLPDLVTRRFDWCLAFAATVLFLGALRSATGKNGAANTRALRWLLAGVLLSLPLCLAGRAEVRTHTFIAPHIGIAAAVASIALHGWEVAHHRGAGWSRRAAISLAAVVLLLFHVAMPIAAVGAELARGGPSSVRGLVERTEIDDAVEVLVIVRTSRQLTRGHFALYHARDLRAVWVLSYGALPGSRCRVARTGPDTLLLSTEEGSVVPRSDFFRSHLAPLPPGSIDLGGLRVEVIEVDGLDVRRVAFQLDRPLEDRSMAFVVEQAGTLVPLPLPPLGSDVVLSSP